MKFLKRILSHICLIPKTIWFPIETIIFAVYEFFYRINQNVKRGYSNRDFEENRIRRIVRRAIGATLRDNTNIMSSYLSKRISKILTLLLQFISFVTTYAGFSFFLGALSPIAPLFLAIVVQGGCYYLINYTSSNKRPGNWRRNLLLFFLVTISVVTSYMGIFNSVVSPVGNIEDTYYSYKSSADNLINYYQEHVIDINHTAEDIENTYNFLTEMYDEAGIEIQNLKTEESGYSSTKQELGTAIDSEGNSYTTVITVDNPGASQVKANIQSKINDLEKRRKDLEEYVTDSSLLSQIINIYSNYSNTTSSENEEENKKIYNEFQSDIKQAEKIYMEVTTEPDKSDLEQYYCDLSNISIKQNLDNARPKEFKSIDENTQETKTNSTDGDKSSKTVELDKSTVLRVMEFGNDLFDSLNQAVVSKDLINAENTRNLVMSYVRTNYREINNILEIETKTKDDKLNEYKKTFQSNYNAVGNMESPQILAIVTPFRNFTTIGKALFSFIIAAIVDGLSLLFAFALIPKRRSSLYFDDISKYRANREEMVEECFMYICLNDINQQETTNEMVESEMEITRRVAEKMNEIMSDFLIKIRYHYFPDEFNAFGYISKDDFDGFSNDEKRLFITFCNISMIQAFHQKEIVELINREFDEKDRKSDNPQANKRLVGTYLNEFEEDQIYYIVSKSLHVWICENFSELLQNTMLFYKGQEEDLNNELSLGDDYSD